MLNIKITTLAENTAELGYLAEWGLCMYIEADGVNVLFDTGDGIAAVHNAQLFGIDFTKVDKIVLSHGHRDHTGGLREVLTRMKKPVEVIAHPDIWASKYTRWGKMQDHYTGVAMQEGKVDLDADWNENIRDQSHIKRKKTGGVSTHYSGIPFQRELLENLGARFNLTTKPVKITDHFLTTGEIPMISSYEEIDSGLFVKKTGELLPDELKDDLALVIDTEYGLVVILGCAHHGIVNTLKQAQKVTGEESIYAAIGGTHLLNAERPRWEKTAADLKKMGVQYLGASHCTGFKASAYLTEQFGDNFFMNNSGSRWTLPFNTKT
jgi:7,8-dihydropterin-6-yl-methyl-4-(beta-D-ribofuranosyl)aminobenzene 5'-phosphate synthase